MQVLEAGALYFALVFAVGFVLGAIRTLWVVPGVSARRAELKASRNSVSWARQAATMSAVTCAISPLAEDIGLTMHVSEV